jgi:4-amino-4-deoxy-L-arabinose transferase
MTIKKTSIALVAVFILLYIVPLGVRPIIIPDEVRYGEIPREMISSGNWVVPRLDGLRYFEKPVLGYWVNALSMLIFGQNAFAIRFPSAIAVGLTTLLIFLILKIFGGGYLSGIIGAGLFFTSPLVYGVGTFSVLDSMLSLLITGSMAAFFWSFMARDNLRKKLLFQVLSGVFCGLAFLTKGFLAFIVPLVSVVPFLLWERRLKDLLQMTWLIIAIAIMVSLPWAVMIHLREPDFWHYFFWIEHIRRFMSNHAQHAKPVWYFIPVLAGGALPWIILTPAAIGKINVRLKEPLIRFALCWFFFPFLFFSASSGKLGTYILPCFPPLIILLSIGLQSYMEKNVAPRSIRISVYFMLILIALFTGLLLISQLTDIVGIKAYGPKETWKLMVGIAALLVWVMFLIGASRTINLKRQLLLYWAAPLFLMLCGHYIIPNQLKAKTSPGEFLLKYASQISPETVLVTNGLERAVCWFYKRDDVYLLDRDGELRYGLSYANTRHRLLSAAQLQQMITEKTGGRNIFFITKTEEYCHNKSLLPKSVFEDTWGRFVIVRF